MDFTSSRAVDEMELTDNELGIVQSEEEKTTNHRYLVDSNIFLQWSDV